uniref:Protein SREK1IP1 n=1 Tax=Parascaris univalens TaxID=6257 RepID=A0A915BEN4_PARUN
MCFDDESIFKGSSSEYSCSSPALIISLRCSGIVDVSGVTMMRTAVTGACRKCGYAGHLAFQCRNFIQPKDSKETFLDISSTSSESDYETPLTSKEEKKKKKKKKEYKKRKKEKKRKSKTREHKHKRKRKHSSSSGSECEKKKKK